MKTKHRFQRFAAVLACLMLCMLCLPAAGAAEAPAGYRYKELTQDQLNAKYSMTLEFTSGETKCSNVTFNIYKVATVDEHIHFHPEEGYGQIVVPKLVNAQGYNDWTTLANTLDSYVVANQVAPTAAAQTNADGVVAFTGLDAGLYLVKGAAYVSGRTTYTPVASVVALPSWNSEAEAWEDLAAHVKSTPYTPPTPENPQPQPQTVRRDVLKIWEDEGNEDQRPASITVELYENGSLYASVTLSARNGWSYSWPSLSAESQWQVVERVDAEDYAISISEAGVAEGMTFVITNTYVEDIEEDDPPLAELPDDPGAPSDPGDPGEPEDPGVEIDDPDVPLANLPQTGQLWWPVPMLAVAGFAMFFFGLARRRSGSEHAE